MSRRDLRDTAMARLCTWLRNRKKASDGADLRSGGIRRCRVLARQRRPLLRLNDHRLLAGVAATALPFIVVGALWEIVAYLQIFPARLFPSLESIASALVRLTVSGVLPQHATDTVLRLISGFAI